MFIIYGIVTAALKICYYHPFTYDETQFHAHLPS